MVIRRGSAPASTSRSRAFHEVSSKALGAACRKGSRTSHFGRSEKEFTWEVPNKAAALAAEARSIQPVRSAANGNGHGNGNGNGSGGKTPAKKPTRKSLTPSTAN